MSGADAVRLAAAEAALRASQRHVRRLVEVLAAVGVKDGDSWCFCGAFGNNPMIPNHSDACTAARRELLLLPLVARP